jgi:alkanesulfonate monooxygenase SsuD/methylene tetrahydromethanopterin reductase-like flavin-dependent oxidoreductase (luciferase family)
VHFGLFGGAKRGVDNSGGDSKSYNAYVDYVIAAEDLGFHSAFSVEHHFTGFGQVSAVLSMLAYIAGRTSRIRLGTAVLVLPWHDPVLLAEQASTVDLLSGGRLDLGVGRGYRPNEFHGFDIDPGEEANERYEECLEVLRKSWTTSGRFSHRGKHFSYNDVIVEPAPAQSPHPPIWIGAGSEASIRGAASSGTRLLVDQFGTIEMTCQRVDWYRDEIERNGGVFDPTHVCAARHLTLLRDDMLHTLNDEYDYRLAGIKQLREASKAPGDDRELTVADHAFYDIARENTEDAVIGGTAEDCITKLKTLESAGVGQVLLIDPSGGIPRLEHFAESVMPSFG